MNFLVLGGGLQGSAAAFDLLQDTAVEGVVVADLDTEHPHPSLRPYLGGRLQLRRLNASRAPDVTAAMKGMDGVLCALPYHFNFEMARLAVESGCHFTDLGGNTAIVGRQRTLDGAARKRGLSVVPDTGLAPGMVNIFAQAGIDHVGSAASVRMYVGGLPQRPEPPLNYQVVYSLQGVLDYYVTPAEVLKGGRRTTVEALSGVELIDFPAPLGQLEAFYTGGGASTLPERYEGQVGRLEYKTLRYPGHAQIMRAIRELGLLSDREIEYDGARISPREFFIRNVTPVLSANGKEDLVAARVEVTGRRQGERLQVRFEVLDFHDEATGFSAMARTTGFSLSITALMQARGQVTAPGVGTPDETVPAAFYVRELAKRGIQVKRSETPLATTFPEEPDTQ